MHVGPLAHRSSHQLLEIGALGELDRLDAARPRFVGEGETLGLAAAGLGVVEEHRMARSDRFG
jgi:hypothetical protein